VEILGLTNAGTGTRPPQWAGGIRLTGRLLAETGLQTPALGVDRLVIPRARAVRGNGPHGLPLMRKHYTVDPINPKRRRRALQAFAWELAPFEFAIA
jgi:hypothetical protein